MGARSQVEKNEQTDIEPLDIQERFLRALREGKFPSLKSEKVKYSLRLRAHVGKTWVFVRGHNIRKGIKLLQKVIRESERNSKRYEISVEIVKG